MAKQCVILGGGGHARVLIDCLRALDERVSVVGILDRDSSRWGADVDGVPIVGDDTMLGALVAAGVVGFLVGLGSAGDNWPRSRLFRMGVDRGLTPITIRHPAAICSARARLGLGVQLLPGSVINAGAKLGDNVIVNSGAVVEHDCWIGAHAHIATRATLTGGVRIAEGAHLGAGSVVRQGIAIGAWAVVGAGAVVTKDVAPATVVVGVPARVLRSLDPSPGAVAECVDG